MNLETRYEDLKVRSIQMKTRVSQYRDSAKESIARYNTTKTKLEDARESLLIQNNAVDVLKELLDRMSQEHIEKIVDLLTYALNTIFYDKNYGVEVVLDDKRNAKTAEFVLIERTETEVIRSSFSDGIGGGIIAIVGCILQVYYIGMFNLSPIIFIDEGFSQVSSQYIDTLLQFIDELANTKEFIFVLVTHDNRLMHRAVRSYEVDDGVVKRINSGEQDG